MPAMRNDLAAAAFPSTAHQSMLWRYPMRCSIASFLAGVIAGHASTRCCPPHMRQTLYCTLVSDSVALLLRRCCRASRLAAPPFSSQHSREQWSCHRLYRYVRGFSQPSRAHGPGHGVVGCDHPSSLCRKQYVKNPFPLRRCLVVTVHPSALHCGASLVG